jgi:hypothetical protein
MRHERFLEEVQKLNSYQGTPNIHEMLDTDPEFYKFYKAHMEKFEAS